MDKKFVSYALQDYSHLLGKTDFSDLMLGNHFKLYQGYVKNVNLILEKLAGLITEEKDRSPEYAELKRRFGWEFNGMRLHEYYFANLGSKEPLDKKSAFYKKISASFGSLESWKQDFFSTGSMRGIGWVLVCLDDVNGQLINTWINEHDGGHLTSTKPLLVMDVFEHAYFTDYQLERPKYLESFFNHVNWFEVEKRLG